MKNPRIIGALLCSLLGLWLPNASALDVHDPHQDQFLRYGLKAMSALDAGSKPAALEALIKLYEERTTCTTESRVEIQYWFAKVYRAEKAKPENLQAYRKLFRAAVYLVDLDWEAADKELKTIPIKQLENPEFAKLLNSMSGYFDYGRRYRAIIALANGFLERGVDYKALPGAFMDRVLGAWFVVSDIKPFVEYMEKFPSAAVHEWVITSYRRLGNQQRANTLQNLLNKREPNNFTQLMTMSAAERETLCQSIIPYYNENLNTDKSEVKSGLSTPNVWAFLLCGKFEDAVNAVDKEGWAGQLGRCQAAADTHNLTDGYNGLVACMYWANKLRVTGRKTEAQAQLLACVENTKRILFIDKSTGYSQAPVVLDDDLDLYLKSLFGWNTEVYILRGMLMEALKRYEDAVVAYGVVLADKDTLPESLFLRIQQWQQRAQRLK